MKTGIDNRQYCTRKKNRSQESMFQDWFEAYLYSARAANKKVYFPELNFSLLPEYK